MPPRNFANPPQVTDEFKNFIRDILLSKVKISRKFIDKMTDDEAMKLFRLAFTDTTYFIDKANTRELLEFLGDTKVNSVITEYLINRHKADFSSEHWLTNLQQKFKSKEVFAKIASELGFAEFILYHEDPRLGEYDSLRESLGPKDGMAEFKNKYGHAQAKYIIGTRLDYKTNLNTLEDTFEAFIGALNNLAEDRIGKGTGYIVIYKFISNFFDEKDYKATDEFVFNPTTRLKILFDAKKLPFSTKSGDNLKYFRVSEGGRREMIYGDPSPEDLKDPNIIIAVYRNKKDSRPIYELQDIPVNVNKDKAIENALEILLNEEKAINPSFTLNIKPRYPRPTPRTSEGQLPTQVLPYTQETF